MRAAHYNDRDDHWNRYYKSGKDFMAITSQEIKRILSYVPRTTQQTALDIGCGTGQVVRELYHNGFQVVGVDIAEDAIDIARALTTIPRAKLRYLHYDFEKDNPSELPFAPYHIITCRYVYAFIENKTIFLGKVQKLLRANGVFVVISPLESSVPAQKKDITVNSEMTRRELERYFKVGYYEELGDAFFICEKIKT